MLGNLDKDLLEAFAVVVVVDDDDVMEDGVGLVIIVVVAVAVVSSWLVPVPSSSAAASFWKVVIVVVKERSKDLGDSRIGVGCCLVVGEPTVERVDDDDDHGASAVPRCGVVVVVLAWVSCGDVGRRMGEISGASSCGQSTGRRREGVASSWWWWWCFEW